MVLFFTMVRTRECPPFRGKMLETDVGEFFLIALCNPRTTWSCFTFLGGPEIVASTFVLSRMFHFMEERKKVEKGGRY
jgi:hypothetical protein